MFESCLKCGVCYENCYLEQMGIASFIRLPLNGDAINIWSCSNCWTCQEICPAGITLMESKWRIQQKTDPPPSYAASLQNIMLCGYCLPIEPEEINSFRIDESLEPIILTPPDTIAILLNNK